MPNSKNLSSYNPDALGEVMPVRFYDEPVKLIQDYLNNDIQPIEAEIKAEARRTQYNEFKLFGRTLHDLWKDEASLAANLILRGEEKDVEVVVNMIKEKPILLHIEVEAEDCRKRKVKGRLIEIAAMAGDVNLKKNIRCFHSCGIVERLIETVNLSKEDIADQLKCLTSEDAKKINEQRNQHILNAIKKFGENIINAKVYEMTFTEYQAYCEPLIKQFKKDLQMDVKDEIITKGYIFDPKILYDAATWYDKNKWRFDSSWSSQKHAIFWINGFGKLQSMLSSRDAQIISYGFDGLSESTSANYPRTIKNEAYWDPNCLGHSHFFHPNGELDDLHPHFSMAYEYSLLISNKNESIEALVPNPRRSCVIT